MSASPESLAPRVARAVLGAVAASVLVALPLVPRLLVLDGPTTAAAIDRALRVVACVATLATMVAWWRVSRTRWTRRAIALGSSAVEPADVVGVARLPFVVAADTVAITAAGLALGFAPTLAPRGVDAHDALGILLVSFVLTATGALVLYVVLRRHVGRVLELVSPDVVRAAIAGAEGAKPPLGHARRMAVAIGAPVALVAVGTAVIAHAHAHALDEQAQIETARSLAEIALFEGSGPVPTAGSDAARAAAAARGFSIQRAPADARFSLRPLADGRVAMTLLAADTAATVRFEPTDAEAWQPLETLVALVALALALVVGSRLGRLLTGDLAAVTERIRGLGTQRAARGLFPTTRPPTFADVAELERGVDLLAARFRVFSAAQERALAARDAARATRALLFASVSHDLRTPLAAILGFTDLLAMSELADAQRESLAVVRERARELFTLVETVLDVSRIEAGELTVAPRAADLAEIVRVAVERVRPADAPTALPLDVEIDEGAPPRVVVDPPRVSQALVALLRHALRDARPRGAAVPSRVRLAVRRAADDRTIELEVAYDGSHIPADELARLLGPDPWMPSRRRWGSFTLGLWLARSLAEMHRGSLRADARGPSTTALTLALPIAPP